MNRNAWLGAAAGAVVVLLVAVGYVWTQGGAGGTDAALSPASRGAGQGAANPGFDGASAAPGTPGAAGSNTAAGGAGAAAGLPGLSAGGTGAMPPGATGADLPAWAASGAAVNKPGVTPLTPLAVGRPGAPTMAEIQQRLQSLTAGGRQPTAREVDGVLADIQKNQGSDVVAGVNIQDLRNTVAAADRIQQIAQEMQAISSNPRKEDVARLQTLNAELLRLQGVMSANAAKLPIR